VIDWTSMSIIPFSLTVSGATVVRSVVCVFLTKCTYKYLQILKEANICIPFGFGLVRASSRSVSISDSSCSSETYALFLLFLELGQVGDTGNKLMGELVCEGMGLGVARVASDAAFNMAISHLSLGITHRYSQYVALQGYYGK
jgi:hypothetical protein